jgi:uncharacterized membrane protein
VGIRQGLMGMLSRLRAPRAEGGEAVREEKETARIEAFSDGVFAIAITLLVLELRPPHDPDAATLRRHLLEMWPSYAAFLTSFATIGIMWVNHHRMFTLIRRVDHGLLMRNLLLLLGVTAVPFPTSLVAAYLGHDGDRLAVSVYAGLFLYIALAFGTLWTYAASRKRRPPLLNVDYRHPDVRSINSRYGVGPVSYLAALVLANYHAGAALGLMMALAAFFALPPRGRK